MCRCLELAGTVSPFISIASPVYHSSCSAAPSMSAFILVMVLPVSMTSVCRSSSPRSRMRLATALRYFPRSLISSAAQAGCAFSAAATALFTSDASPATNSPIRSSLAGLTDSIHLSASPATISPPISICPFIWACTFMTKLPGVIAAAAIGEPKAVVHCLSRLREPDKRQTGGRRKPAGCSRTRNEQRLHVRATRHLRIRWLEALAQFSLQDELACNRKGVLHALGFPERDIEKCFAEIGPLGPVLAAERRMISIGRGDDQRIGAGEMRDEDAGIAGRDDHRLMPHARARQHVGEIGGREHLGEPPCFDGEAGGGTMRGENQKQNVVLGIHPL